MLDANYFREGLRKQVEQVGGNPVVYLILDSGQELIVRDVVEAQPGYVMINMYPPDQPAGIVAPSSSAYSMVPAAGYYPVALRYESISRVHVSSTTADQRPRLGFNA